MEENRYFQYLAGERKGEILFFDKIEEEDGLVFISFKDGSRCNKEFILPLNERNWTNQLMAEVSDTKNIWRFKEEWVGRQEEKRAKNADGENVIVQPFIEGRKKITPIPPNFVKVKFDNIDRRIETPTPKTSHANDPVWITLEKSKKIDTEINMSLVISLPSKSLFNVIKESFENGAVKAIEYIIENLDDTKIKNGLSDALYAAYEEKESPPPPPPPPPSRLIKEGKRPPPPPSIKKSKITANEDG